MFNLVVNSRHLLMKLEAFLTDSTKSTFLTASAAIIEEKTSPVPERSIPIFLARTIE